MAVPSAAANLPFFSGIPRERLADDLRAVPHFTVGAGEVLAQEGEADDGMIVLLRGEVDVLVGAPPRRVAQIRRGELAGSMALFRPAWRRSATLKTASVCEMLVLDSQVLTALHQRRSPLLLALEDAALGSLGRRLRRMDIDLQARQWQPPAVAPSTAGNPSRRGLLGRATRWLSGAPRSLAHDTPHPHPVQALAASPLFAHLSPQSPALEGLAELCVPVRFEAGQVLFRAGQLTRQAWFLTAGAVHHHGQGNIASARPSAGFGPGTLLDPVSLVHGTTHAATMVAARDGWALTLRQDRVRALCASPDKLGSALRAGIYESLFSQLTRATRAAREAYSAAA